jgi:hypothetical protein
MGVIKMKVKQVYTLLNAVTKELTGKTDLVLEDLTNVVDVGKTILDSTDVDNYVKSLVNHIGKVIFVNRIYRGSVPSVLMDSWEFGSVLEKVTCGIPEAKENETWGLQDGKSYDTNVFYKPSVSMKLFNSKVTFEIPISFTEVQVKESFSNADQLNGFYSMIENAVLNSFTIKMDSLIARTINNMIAETYHADNSESTAQSDFTGVKAVNLLKLYKDTNTEASTLTVKQALTDSEFLKFAVSVINNYKDRIGTLSTLFNVGGVEQFTPQDRLNVVLLSEFKNCVNSYLASGVYNKEYVALPKNEVVAYWQGSGTNFAFEDTSKINVTTSAGNTVEISGIVGVMFDRDALGVTNLNQRVTTNYNAKAEFFNNYYKFDAGYFNDLNENLVFFFVA